MHLEDDERIASFVSRINIRHARFKTEVSSELSSVELVCVVQRGLRVCPSVVYMYKGRALLCIYCVHTMVCGIVYCTIVLPLHVDLVVTQSQGWSVERQSFANNRDVEGCGTWCV